MRPPRFGRTRREASARGRGRLRSQSRPESASRIYVKRPRGDGGGSALGPAIQKSKKAGPPIRRVGMEIRPLAVGRKLGRFSLFDDLVDALDASGTEIGDGDVVAISSKYVSASQGRVVDLGGVKAYPGVGDIAKRYGMPERFAEVVLRESDAILGGIAGFAMASVDGILAPNAGIDRSNSGGGAVVLYPHDPHGAAEGIRRKIFLRFQANVGVIITDSRLMPARAGTVGVAIACAGMEPVDDMRAQMDLDGNPLKVTVRASADSLATAANYGMGEGAESRPYAVIKGSNAGMTSRRAGPGEVAIPHDQCVYMRSLAGARPGPGARRAP